MISVRLGEVLKAKNRTIYWLSKETGITQNTLTNLINGNTKSVSFDILDKICKTLKCDLSNVLKFSPELDWDQILKDLANSDLDVSGGGGEEEEEGGWGEEDDYSEYSGRYIEYKTYRKLEDQHNELIDKNSELELKLEKLTSSIEKVKKILES